MALVCAVCFNLKAWQNVVHLHMHINGHSQVERNQWAAEFCLNSEGIIAHYGINGDINSKGTFQTLAAHYKTAVPRMEDLNFMLHSAFQ